MTAYAIDWEGAYDAWKQSGLPRRRFKYSEQFKSFIGEGGMQSEDTVRTRFRSIRDQRGNRYVATVNSETEQQPVELNLSEPVKIFRFNQQKKAFRGTGTPRNAFCFKELNSRSADNKINRPRNRIKYTD